MKYQDFLHLLLDTANLTQPYLEKLKYRLVLDISYEGLLTITIFTDDSTGIVENMYLFSSEQENAEKQRDALAFLEKYLPF